MSDGETEVSATAEWAKHRELLKRVTDNETSINRLDKALETICDKDIKEIGEKAERAMARSRGVGLHLDLKPYTGNSNDLVFSEFLDRFDRLAANLPEMRSATFCQHIWKAGRLSATGVLPTLQNNPTFF